MKLIFARPSDRDRAVILTAMLDAPNKWMTRSLLSGKVARVSAVLDRLEYYGWAVCGFAGVYRWTLTEKGEKLARILRSMNGGENVAPE